MATDRNIKVLLVNCDNLVDLEVVKNHLFGKSPPDVEIIYFSVEEMETKSKEIAARTGNDRPHCAIFIVNAQESRLSINETYAGIGYAKMYTALKDVTNDHVIVGIAGDDHSTGKNKLISKEALNRIHAQFGKDYIQGPKGYVFSWNHFPTEEHRWKTDEFIISSLQESEETQLSNDDPIQARRSSTRSKKEEVERGTGLQVSQPTTGSKADGPGERTGLQPLKVIMAVYKTLDPYSIEKGLFSDSKGEWLDVKILTFEKGNIEKKSTEIGQLGGQGPCLGIMIVNSRESRLSINEPDAGIGYTGIYQSLQSVTGNNVIVVLAQDREYDAEQQLVISRPALLGIKSQFTEECLDGTYGCVFSWKDSPQYIHRKRLLKYLKSKKLITTDIHEKWLKRIDKHHSTGPVNANFPPPSLDVNPVSPKKASSYKDAEESRICYEDYSGTKVKLKTSFFRSQKEVSATDILKKRCDENTVEVVKKYIEYVQDHNKPEIVGIFAYLPDGRIDDHFSATLLDKNILDCKKCPSYLMEDLKAPENWYDTFVIVERKGENYKVKYNSLDKVDAPAKDLIVKFLKSLVQNE